jgi:hypothetical protein
MQPTPSHRWHTKLIGTAEAVILACSAATGYAQITEMLHETQDGTRDNYTGVIGTEFRVGSSNVVVSHVGVYDNNADGLSHAHNAGIFDATGSTLLGQAAFATGTGAYLTNGVRWMPLDPPLLLSSNTTYVVASDVFNASGDPWKDSFSPTNWNPRFVGTNGAATQKAHYSASLAAWPTFPASSFGSGVAYGNATLGYIEIDKARVGVASTSLAVSVGQPLNLAGFASGAAGITYQWFKAPATLLTGKTNVTLTIPSAALTDSGTYYLTATNSIGGSQSANIVVTVTAFPVGIQQGPTNLTVLGNYTATFSAVVTGSPPISVQWLRNGTPVSGANGTSYSFTATSANNAESYSIFASNNISGTPYTATSAFATLTVIPNLAQPQQFLHGKANTSTNTFAGCVGGSFITGPRQTMVTHLGYYATEFTDASHANLNDAHTIYIFNADYSTNASVVVAAGTGLAVVNGYIWAALNPPVTLAANTTYILGADTTINDPWGDAYVVPDWSSYYTDPANSSSFAALYNVSGSAPYYGGYGGLMYSAPNMAILPVGAPSAWVSPTSVTQYVGLSVTLTGLVNGQAPLTAQWYKAPSTLLTGQTNLTLILANPVVGDSGNYYLVASNSVTTAQSANAAVTIIPTVGPSIVQDVQSQDVLVYSTVNFSVGVSGTPPFSYQWSFNGSPVSGATNSVFTVYNASSASVGNYRVAVTSPYGSTASSIASLTVSAPPWGSYPSAVMGTNLLAYYRFSDVNSGLGVATNMGSLGFAYDGTYEGAYGGTDGPLGMSHFGGSNPALLLDGLTSDVLIPPLYVTLANATIAAWVYSGGDQPDNSAIYYHRGGSVFGLGVFGGTNTLKYTWAGGQFNFESGLVLPTNQWAFVAMVITPTNGTLYLQDGTSMQTANNLATQGSVTFDSASYVGWDTAGGDIGRRWTGGVDELMIFDRALTPVEVNALYLGVPGSATLTIVSSGGNVILTWPGGKLLEAANITGPWTTNSAAASPYTVSAGGASKFYRVQLQP